MSTTPGSIETRTETARPGPGINGLLPLLLMSGATSLVYETIWARQLHLVFGTSQLAICTLLAAFMAGLALGGFLAGRWAQRVRRPLVWYAGLEALIGAYAVVFPWLLLAVEPLYLGFWRVWEPGVLGFSAFQALLLTALLLPPTLAMGATLPLLARFVSVEDQHAGRNIGRLYGVNTIGAVIGVALAGFVLLPSMGLTLTTWIAAAGNVVVAIAALKLAASGSWTLTSPGPASQAASVKSQASKPSRLKKQAASLDTPLWDSRSRLRALLLIAALAGACALVYEVAWFRLMVLVLGGSAYAFSIMLLAFLVGIGVGGWAGGTVADRLHARGGATWLLRGLAMMQVGIAVITWLSMFAYEQLPYAFVWMYDKVQDSVWLWPGQVVLGLMVMLPAALLMGAAFPVLVRAAADSAAGDADAAAGVSRPVGNLYAANTLGAVVGAFAGGFVMLPQLHMKGTVLTAAALNIVAGLAALRVSSPPARIRILPPLRWTLAAGTLVFLMILLRPQWDPRALTSGLYQEVANLTDRSREGVRQTEQMDGELLFYDEGLSSVVTVGKESDSENMFLANNGKIDASSLGDRLTQALLAHLPFVFAPKAERVLVIGLASGTTAGCVTLHDSPTRIDVVELEPAIVAASHFFDDYNYHPLEDPRVRLHLNDGRNHVKLAQDQTYDIIISEPPNPWLTGVANLFTREFFEMGKRKLTPGGVWSQWVQTYCMGPDELRSLLATFGDTFAHVRMFRLDGADTILIGSDGPLSMDISSMAKILGANPQLITCMKSVGMDTAEELLSLFLFDEKGIHTLAGDARRNTDDNMLIEYSAPLYLRKDTVPENSRLLYSAVQVPLDVVDTPQRMVGLTVSYFMLEDTPRAMKTLEAALAKFPNDPDVMQLAESVKKNTTQAATSASE